MCKQVINFPEKIGDKIGAKDKLPHRIWRLFMGYGGIHMKKVGYLIIVISVLLCSCASASEVPDMAARLYLTVPVDLQLDETSLKTDEAGYISGEVLNVESLSEIMLVEKPREIIYIALGEREDVFTQTDEIKNIKDVNQKALGKNMMAGSCINGSNRVITEKYPIELVTPHKYTAASEDNVPDGATLSKAFGFDVDSKVKLDKEIEFDILPNQSANVSVYPVYDRYTFDIVKSAGGKTSGGTGELYKVAGFCVVISDNS